MRGRRERKIVRKRGRGVYDAFNLNQSKDDIAIIRDTHPYTIQSGDNTSGRRVLFLFPCDTHPQSSDQMVMI